MHVPIGIKKNAKKIRSLSHINRYGQVSALGRFFVKVIHNIICLIGSNLLLKGFINVTLEDCAKESYVADT